jgi:hypothetical protein
MYSKGLRIFLVLVAMGAVLWSFAASQDQGSGPRGWFLAGSHPDQYSVGVDHAIFHSGKGSAYLEAKRAGADGFGTLMQTINAAEFLGQRVRMSGYLKTAGIEQWAGMWMRIDSPDKKPLGFDNMQGRPLKGSTDWTRCEIVLDVPKNSVDVAFGVLLSGVGRVWIDDIKFEVVDLSVPTTGTGEAAKAKPTNLDFEE